MATALLELLIAAEKFAYQIVMCRQVVKEITKLCSGVVPLTPAEDVDGADGGPVQVRAHSPHQLPGTVQTDLAPLPPLPHNYKCDNYYNTLYTVVCIVYMQYIFYTVIQYLYYKGVFKYYISISFL